MRTSTVIAACLAIFSGLANHASHAGAMPSFQQVRAQHQSSYAVLLDRNDNILQMLQMNHATQRLPWVALRDLSPAMQKALLVSEDRRFFQHHGVDWRAFVGAAWENLLYDTHRGASTLTMQLAGLLDPKLARTAGGRTYAQKWQQIKAAGLLEKHWTKGQILEAYLNLVNFRANLSGINAASEALFNVPPASLNTAQATILAALLRGPNAEPAIVAARACGVAHHLKSPRPSCTIITKLADDRLSPHPKIPLGAMLAPELAQQYLTAPGERLTTSLNIKIQRLALSSLSQQLKLAPEIGAGAIVVISNTTAEILAYADAHSDDTANIDQIPVLHPITTLAQAFLYELAIEQRQLTAASVLNNSPLPISTPNLFPAYANDASAQTWVSVRTALGTALIVPAWHTLDIITPHDFSNRLQMLGLKVADPDQPALVQASLLSLANAYQALANQGMYRTASFRIGGAQKSQLVLSANASAIINNILADPNAHGADDITPIHGYAAYALAQNAYQQWCIGSTGAVTVAVWMGNNDQKSITDPDNHAVAVWRSVINALNDGLFPGHAPKLPSDLVVEDISYEPPIEPPRKELFLPGTELPQFRPATSPATPVIP
ncbi:MAG: transglycosylase domain-containing protein [Sulfuriferula sp.]